MSNGLPNTSSTLNGRRPSVFLSLAPLASPAHLKSEQTAWLSDLVPTAQDVAAETLQRMRRSSSLSSDASAASDGGVRFLKLGHDGGNWSEVVVRE